MRQLRILVALVATCCMPLGTVSEEPVPDPLVEVTTTDAPRPVVDWTPRAPASVPRMEADLAGLLGFGPRPAGSSAEHGAAVFLEGRLRALTGEVVVEEVPLPNGLASRNLFGAVGEGPVEVLLGAHYDSVPGSPGADDNGSGTVVLLELARLLAPDPVPGVRVTIVFFGAEEVLEGHDRDAHHFGSRQAAGRMAEEGSLPDWMVSVDMVGVGDRLLAVNYRDSDGRAADLLRQAGAAGGTPVTVASRGDISDHVPFARAGVPSAFLWRPDNPAYHTSADTTVRSELLLENLVVLQEFLARTAP